MTVAYGDNINDLITVVRTTLRHAQWGHDKIESITQQIGATKSYDEAVAICRKYITVRGVSPPPD